MGGGREMEPVVETILVVDDDKTNRTLLSIILKNEEYRVVEAEDGRDALEKGLTMPIDLVLLDIMMPKMDGYEACKRLKADPRTRDIPVVFLSAKSGTRDKIMGLDSGGADYVTKPFDKGEVLARVRSQLRIRSLTREVIEKQKHLDNDLKVAAGIQQSLLPSREVPGKSSLKWAWRFKPCDEIGGDIFNILRLDERHYAVYMLDVSGHGVPSALVTVSASQMLQPHTNILVRQDGEGSGKEIIAPVDVVKRLDHEYPMERFDKYFTLVYMLIDTERGLLSYSNAGHPPPLLIRTDGTVKALEKGGPMVGLNGALPFEEEEISLDPGDRVILYTDGVIEYEKTDLEFYGEERFHAVIKRSAGLSIDALSEAIMEDLMAFGEGAPPRDDITLLAIESRGDVESARS
jgi:phosphoserine phosphatase RsbU/P